MKQILSNITTLATIISILVSVFATVWGLRKSKDADDYKNTLYSKTVEYEDELGRKVTEVVQMEVSIKEMKETAKKDSNLLSDYEKKLQRVYKELQSENKKLKDVESAMLFSSSTHDKFAVKMETEYEKEVMPGMEARKVAKFENDWFKQEIIYDPNTDTLYVDKLERNEFFIDAFRQRKAKANGKQAFYPFRWRMPWEYKASVKSLRDSTVIQESIYLNMKK